MKITVTVIYAALVLSGIILIPNAFGEYVPAWVKNTAGWWATDAISETEFVNAIEFLVKENIILVNVSQTSETSQGVPEWVKNTAGWWATDAISETEFVNAIAYLIENGIISIESSMSPELIAEMWVNGDINDNEFLAHVEHLIKIESITIPVNQIAKTSQLPDWLVNNAGWWTARIFTNSDFVFDHEYVKEEIYPCIKFSTDTSCLTKTYNSYGFRGNEFEKEKPVNTFRIFTVGGSTTFGAGADDDMTWPAHLQQMINEKIIDKEIEVINAGMPGGQSGLEYDTIKNKLLSFDPDLIIMYDGWNDYGQFPAEKTIRNWESVCELGKNKGFDTIIIVQPLPITGLRVLAEQEIGNSFLNLKYLQKSQQYVDALEELDNVCTETADFRSIFDYIQEPIFYDDGHTMSFGNKIIAENVFSVISPIYFDKTYSVIHSLQIEKNESGTGVVYAVGADLSSKNFDNLNLQNAVFDKADLSNTSFKNVNIDGARFVLSNLSNSNLLDRIDLSNINLAGTDLSNVSLKEKNLSGTMLTGADLTGAILTGADLTGAILTGADLTGAILKDVDLSGKDLSNTILKDVDLSGKDLSGTNLSFSDLRFSDLSGTILSDSILLRANLSKIDLRTAKLDNADFAYANLSESKLSDSVLVNNNFDHATLKNISFAGKDLSGSTFKQAELDGSDMQNTNLSYAAFVQVDFTKIKNKSLARADLTSASFAHSNLSGVNLSGVILDATNFWQTNLSDQDFTVTSGAAFQGSMFMDANLSNSNFEGIDMAPKIVFTAILKNKAHLNNLSDKDLLYLIDEDEAENKLIASIEVLGYDLSITYVYINNFDHANLENANFKNANLRITNFASANLANADLSGANLIGAFLSNADLSNADLSGADLSNAIWNENTILKCKNHPICLDE